MDEKLKLDRFDGEKVEVLGATYQEGLPEGPDLWRAKLTTRKEMLAYIRTADRYWLPKESFGSEKRKNPA